MTSRLRDQRREIQNVLDSREWTIEELADDIVLNRETMRKYAKGYQPASKRIMSLIRSRLPRPQQTGPRQKLAKTLSDRGMTPADLAKEMGYDGGIIENLVNGTGRISEKMAEKIITILPELTKEDLMDGSDDVPTVGDSMHGMYGQKSAIIFPEGVSSRMVPLLSNAQAGEWDAAHTDEGYVGSGVLAMNVDDRSAFAMKVSGNSMEPQLFDGDYVICSPRAALTKGQCTLVVTRSENVYIKFWKQKDGIVTLESANEGHPPIKLPVEEIAKAWPVIQHVPMRKIIKQGV